MSGEEKLRRLLSLPAAAVAALGSRPELLCAPVFAASDPPGRQLGSGGGTAWLLHAAWRRAARSGAARNTFEEWLAAARNIVVHGSGESRRLPAYAAVGKPLIPLPLLSDPAGRRPGQCLADLQFLAYERLLRHAPATYGLLIGCGDVFLRHEHWPPPLPAADVLIFGLPASAEEAQRHGVLLCSSDGSPELVSFLQKPTAAQVRREQQRHSLLLDTGLWLLSPRATAVLLRRCGWNARRQRFAGAAPRPYDLYGAFGPALGRRPVRHDPLVQTLSCAVAPLRGGRFYHFGTSRSLLASVGELLQPAGERHAIGHASLESAAPPLVQYSSVAAPLPASARHIWIENSCLPAGWRLAEKHILTGVPPNDWRLRLAPGDCLDFVPCGREGTAIRCYGFDDAFRGPLRDPATLWLGRPAAEWLRARRLTPADAGCAAATDIHDAPLFPILPAARIDADFVHWLLAARPAPDERWRRLWLTAPRISASGLLQRAALARLARRRPERAAREAAALASRDWLERCPDLDLACAARLFRRSGLKPPPAPPATRTPGLTLAHDRMFRSQTATAPRTARRLEQSAFDALHRTLVAEMEQTPVRPLRNVLEDQIVWGRSPVRLDLAGGWTDTPPYCLEHGGQVLNVAVDLNGQPPIQVFARLCPEPHIVVRSIDLGVETRIRAYDELLRREALGGGFGIARAALALAGWHPRFHVAGGCRSLRDQLRRDLGGGIEISLLAAVPKGSGLGTSSILAATLLGTLGELCGLNWSLHDLFLRTLALEQILTSGGGWQDQAGGITPGLKLVSTAPGLAQKPTFRWLPDRFFAAEYANERVLLYYTGITRVARDILADIVRAIFLNDTRRLSLIRDIGQNALFTADAVQRGDWDGLCEAIRRSWTLNRLLDAGTNPPAVQSILRAVGDWISAAKLLGAGGGGYLLLLAKDAAAARRIRERLTAAPPNPRARFVALRLSPSGFQATRS